MLSKVPILTALPFWEYGLSTCIRVAKPYMMSLFLGVSISFDIFYLMEMTKEKKKG